MITICMILFILVLVFGVATFIADFFNKRGKNNVILNLLPVMSVWLTIGFLFYMLVPTTKTMNTETIKLKVNSDGKTVYSVKRGNSPKYVFMSRTGKKITARENETNINYNNTNVSTLVFEKNTKYLSLFGVKSVIQYDTEITANIIR